MKQILLLAALLCLFAAFAQAADLGYIGEDNDNFMETMGLRTLYYDSAFLIPYLKPGMKVLDVGCGPGSITIGIANQVGSDGQVVGLDFDPSAIAQANALAANLSVENIEFVEADASDMPFANETFDIVYMSALLSHTVHLHDKIKAEADRVLKKGGLFANRDNNIDLFFAWPELPAAKTIFSYYDFGSPIQYRDFNMGRKLKAFMMDMGLDIIHTDIFGDIKYSDFFVPVIVDAIANSTRAGGLTPQEISTLRAQFQQEFQLYLAEPGRLSGYVYVNVIGKKAGESPSVSVQASSSSTPSRSVSPRKSKKGKGKGKGKGPKN